MSTTRQDKSRHRGARFRARRRAVELIFEAEARDLDPVAIVEDRITLAAEPDTQVPPVPDYTQHIVRGIAEELDRVDDVISRYLLDNWLIERLPAVDRAIMRVAVWELLFNAEVPVATAVVEAVELASTYSTDAAPPYINAALDAVAHAVHELRAENADIALADAVVVLDESDSNAEADTADVDSTGAAPTDARHIPRLRWLPQDD